MSRGKRDLWRAVWIAALSSCVSPATEPLSPGAPELPERPEPPEPVEAAGPAVPPPPVQPAVASREVVWKPIGYSVDGRPIEAATFGPSGSDGSGHVTVLILATIHGDEAAGTPLLERFASELAQRPDWSRDRRVVVVPVVNPDGFERSSRRNARAVDLNRNFPAANWSARNSNGPAALSEPEARAIATLIRDEQPARILSFHQPVNSIDWDGPAGELAEALSQASPLPVRRLGARPGSLGSWAGVDLGIPTITVELPRAADRLDTEELWQAYGEMLIAAVAFE